MLVIEVDGITHDDPQQILKDKQRDKNLEIVGFKILRFGSWEVIHRMAEVSIEIGKCIDEMESKL